MLSTNPAFFPSNRTPSVPVSGMPKARANRLATTQVRDQIQSSRAAGSLNGDPVDIIRIRNVYSDSKALPKLRNDSRWNNDFAGELLK